VHFISVLLADRKTSATTPALKVPPFVFNINAIDHSQSNALYKACKTCNTAGVVYLLEKAGADPFLTFKRTPADDRFFGGSDYDYGRKSVNHAKSLLNDECSYLHIAAKFGRSENLAALVNFVAKKDSSKVHAYVNKENSAGATPLHFACYYCRPSCIAVLHNNGGDLQRAPPQAVQEPQVTKPTTADESEDSGGEDGAAEKPKATPPPLLTPIYLAINTPFKMLTYVGSCDATSSHNRAYVATLQLALAWSDQATIEQVAANFSIADHGKRRSYYYNYDDMKLPRKSVMPTTLAETVAAFIATHLYLFPNLKEIKERLAGTIVDLDRYTMAGRNDE